MAAATTTKRPQQQQQAPQQAMLGATRDREEAATPAEQGAASAVAEQGKLLDQRLADSADQLDAVAASYAEAIQDPAVKAARRAMLIAAGIERLEGLISDQMLDRFMRLMNTKLGFMTDRDPGKGSNKPLYDKATVKRCIIQGLLNGFLPVNNEMNIIAGGFYPAQAGWKRKVEEIPGLTDLEMIPGPIGKSNGFTCAHYAARWKFNGEPHSLKDSKGNPGRTFLIISYENSTPDNVLGKAKAKAYRAIYEQVTGTEHTAPDEAQLAEGEIPSGNGARPGSRTEALGQKIGAAEQPAPDEALQQQQTPSGAKSASPAQRDELERLRAQLNLTPEEAGIKSQMTEAEADLALEDLRQKWEAQARE